MASSGMTKRSDRIIAYHSEEARTQALHAVGVARDSSRVASGWPSAGGVSVRATGADSPRRSLSERRRSSLPAIDRHVRPVDPARPLRQQEDRHVGDLLRRAQPLRRELTLLERRIALWGVAAHPIPSAA